MNRGRGLTIGLALLAILTAIVWRAGVFGSSDTPGASTTAKAGPDDIAVSFAYSPEKERLLVPLIAAFNQQRDEVNGHRVVVTGQVVSSGDAAARIADDRLHPTVWNPSSSLWGRLLNYDRDRSPVVVGDLNPSLVRTPLVIAMWEPLARALGWPKKPIGWADILAQARSARGWAAYGHPEWGRFKLGHTNPDFSTSGLSAVAAEYLTATGKTEGLSVADVGRPDVRAAVRAIETSIVHYGDTTLFFAERLAEFGPGYASAVAMEETTLLDFNERLATDAGQRLAAIYPKEGTFESDNPLIILNAPWVSADQREGANRLLAFLAGKVTAELAGQFGFRPPSPAAQPSARIGAANLVDPSQPKRRLVLPQPDVLNAIRKAWRLDRKPANVLLVVDVSGSMNDEGRLEAAKGGLDRFLTILQPQDQVGLTIFNSNITPLEPPTALRTSRAALRKLVKQLIADGGTRLYDATEQGVKALRTSASAQSISAVVVLSDGEDTASTTGLTKLLGDLGARGSEDVVRVFTIAYGSSAAREPLAQIARAGRGKAYVGSTDTIDQVYTQIASFF